MGTIGKTNLRLNNYIYLVRRVGNDSWISLLKTGQRPVPAWDWIAALAYSARPRPRPPFAPIFNPPPSTGSSLSCTVRPVAIPWLTPSCAPMTTQRRPPNPWSRLSGPPRLQPLKQRAPSRSPRTKRHWVFQRPVRIAIVCSWRSKASLFISLIPTNSPSHGWARKKLCASCWPRGW